MTPSEYLLLVVLMTFRGVGAVKDVNSFVFPTASGPPLNYVGNPVFELGEIQSIQWITNLTSYSIALWQQGIKPGYGYSLGTVYSSGSNVEDTDAQSFDWTVQLYSANLTFSPIFFFWLNPNTKTGISSHYFNISMSEEQSPSAVAAPESTSTTLKTPAETSSTSSTAATTATTGIPSTESASGTASQTSTETSPTAPAISANASDTSGSQPSVEPGSSSQSNDLPLKIGVGVGVGVGGTLVILLAVLLGMNIASRRRRASQTNLPVYPSSDPPPEQEFRSFPTHVIPAEKRTQVHEVQDRPSSPVELGQRYY